MRKIKGQKQNGNNAKTDKKKTDGGHIVYIAVFIFAAVFIALFFAVILPHIKGGASYHKIENDTSGDGRIVTDSDTGIKYALCARSLSARNKGEPFAKADGVTFYEMRTVSGEKIDTKEYIADEYDMVFRNAGLDEVTLNDFEAIGAYIFHDGAPTGGELFPEKQYLPEGEREKEDLPDDHTLTKETVDAVLFGTEAFPTGEIVSEDTYELKLCSAKYPALYYSLYCMRDENGMRFIYDASGNSYFKCPDALAVRMWGND